MECNLSLFWNNNGLQILPPFLWRLSDLPLPFEPKNARRLEKAKYAIMWKVHFKKRVLNFYQNKRSSGCLTGFLEENEMIAMESIRFLENDLPLTIVYLLLNLRCICSFLKRIPYVFQYI